MANGFMADIGSIGASSIIPKKSTSRPGNTEMKMEDFLTLMVVQLQNQTIDDTADTGEMLNQLVQMQMVTALSNMTDASIMSYASSLVGKEVTIGYVDGDNKLHEEVLKVIGTGLYDGQQVIFCDDGNMYSLSQIMAVGRLPEIEETDPENPDKEEDGDEITPPDIDSKPPIDGSNNGNTNDGDGETDGVNGSEGTDGVNGADGSGESNNDTETGGEAKDPLEGGLLDDLLKDPNEGKTYTGEQGVPTEGTE